MADTNVFELSQPGSFADPLTEVLRNGALGFWQAVEEVWPQTRGQRCWVDKTANVLNKLPKSQQPKAKRALQEIWMAETKKSLANVAGRDRDDAAGGVALETFPGPQWRSEVGGADRGDPIRGRLISSILIC